MDWLGDVAGITGFLMNLACSVFGGYISYHSSIETMKSLYSIPENFQECDCDHDGDEDHEEGDFHEGGNAHKISALHA